MVSFLDNFLGKKARDNVSGQSQPGAKSQSRVTKTKDLIAPSIIEVDFDYLKIEGRYYRTLWVVNYPRFAHPSWLAPLINFGHTLDISMFIYPSEGTEVLHDLKRKITEMQAEISGDVQHGKAADPATQAKLEDALALQEQLVKGIEKFFQFGLYFTVSADSLEKLNEITKELEANLGALMIVPKKSFLQAEEGFKSTLPICEDILKVWRNMDTTSVAMTFPFVSSELSDDKGIMYGLNEHNGSLVIFDRFSMENYNSTIFATSGAGKSYLVKLEALRSLMFDAEILVIDPENEYKDLCQAVGGQYISFGFNSPAKINPFDLELSAASEEENELTRKILSLHAFFKIVMGQLSPQEEALLDRALVETYKLKGITPDPATQKGKEMPLVEDLYKVLIGKEEEIAQNLAARMEKLIKGSFAGLFNSQTTVNISNQFVVFGIRDLEEALRPLAMHVILEFIWNKIRRDMKKRLLIVDEAWYLMKYPDSAQFLYGITKRARKYYLGVTTITQDVHDFLAGDYGKAIVNNSAIRILLKQHPAAVDEVAKAFYLSEGEKQFLLAAEVGEGIFFAGPTHVAIKIFASPEEHRLITSKPEEILQMRKEAQAAVSADQVRP